MIPGYVWIAYALVPIVLGAIVIIICIEARDRAQFLKRHNLAPSFQPSMSVLLENRHFHADVYQMAIQRALELELRFRRVEFHKDSSSMVGPASIRAFGWPGEPCDVTSITLEWFATLRGDVVRVRHPVRLINDLRYMVLVLPSVAMKPWPNALFIPLGIAVAVAHRRFDFQMRVAFALAGLHAVCGEYKAIAPLSGTEAGFDRCASQPRR